MLLTGKQVRISTVKMLLHSRGNAYKNANYIRKHGIFYSMGQGCYYHPRKLPTEPALVSLGNNVWISSNVRFITHDMAGDMLKRHPKYELEFSKIYSPYYMGKIEIGNNVMIGADAIIMYDVKIEDDCIIAAGSVVTKDIPQGSVVAGVPGKVIGTLDEFVEKRRPKLLSMPKKEDGLRGLMEYFWMKDSDRKG